MDLKDFVKESIVQIDSAMKEAADAIGADISLVRENSKGIDFDVAVTVNEAETQKMDGGAKANIQVLSLGATGTKEQKDSSKTVSRIRFTVGGQLG